MFRLNGMRHVTPWNSLLSKSLRFKGLNLRLFYAVHHNPQRGIFYVKLKDASRAVLRYTREGKVLDMQSINVPSNFKREGIARLLAETAFTYAIVNYYYMYLTCDYLQKYYLAVKNPDLEDRVIGPSHILDGPDSEALDPDLVYELPDPEDFMIRS